VYGALFTGKPIIYIGPNESHVSDILDELKGNISVEHGQVEKLVEEILEFSKHSDEYLNKISTHNKKYASEKLQPEILKQKMAIEF
jgi:hypothetical protein